LREEEGNMKKELEEKLNTLFIGGLIVFLIIFWFFIIPA